MEKSLKYRNNLGVWNLRRRVVKPWTSDLNRKMSIVGKQGWAVANTAAGNCPGANSSSRIVRSLLAFRQIRWDKLWQKYRGLTQRHWLEGLQCEANKMARLKTFGTPYPSCRKSRGSDCSAVKCQEMGAKEDLTNQSISYVVSKKWCYYLIIALIICGIKILWSG